MPTKHMLVVVLFLSWRTMWKELRVLKKFISRLVMFIALRKCQQLENDFSCYEIIKSSTAFIPPLSNAMFSSFYFCTSHFCLAPGSHQTMIHLVEIYKNMTCNWRYFDVWCFVSDVPRYRGVPRQMAPLTTRQTKTSLQQESSRWIQAIYHFFF